MKYSSEWCIGGVDINAVKLSMRMYIYRKHKFRDTIANVSTQHSKYNVSIFSIDRQVIYKYRYVYTQCDTQYFSAYRIYTILGIVHHYKMAAVAANSKCMKKITTVHGNLFVLKNF